MGIKLKVSALILFVWPCVGAAQPPHHEPMPDLLYSDVVGDPQYPVWVSAERALDDTGAVDNTVLPPWAVSDLASRLARANEIPGACEEVISITEGPDGDRVPTTVRAEARAADWVFIGRVTGQSPGFLTGIPGTLLRIIPGRVLQGPKGGDGPRFLFVDAGRIPVGPLTLCLVNDEDPELPELGDEVLVMAPLSRANSEAFLFPGEAGWIVLKRDGTIRLPLVFRDWDASQRGPGDRGRLVSEIEEVLGSSGGVRQ